jgi:hypothetical protein
VINLDDLHQELRHWTSGRRSGFRQGYQFLHHPTFKAAIGKEPRPTPSSTFLLPLLLLLITPLLFLCLSLLLLLRLYSFQLLLQELLFEPLLLFLPLTTLLLLFSCLRKCGESGSEFLGVGRHDRAGCGGGELSGELVLECGG